MCKKKYRTLIIMLVAVNIVVLMAANFVKIVVVSGDSMAPTLRSGQLVIIVKGESNIQVNDIVVFDDEELGVCIKRVIATNGSTVQFKSDGIYINRAKVSDLSNIASIVSPAPLGKPVNSTHLSAFLV